MAEALRLARRFSEDARVPGDAADQLAIIIEEWVLNAVEHGGPPARSLIVLELERTQGAVRIAASDPGAPFDPRAVEFLGPNLERGGGAGLALIKAWATIESYRRIRGRNRVVMSLPI